MKQTAAASIPPWTANQPTCRSCGSGLSATLVDLGMSPLCQTHIEPEKLNAMEPFYPLHVWVCGNCYLVQLEEYVSPDAIFSDYAYFSSYSDSWLEHAKRYVDMACARFDLGRDSRVVEIASNDGYLLQNFVGRGVPCLGIEPAANVAQAAVEKGVPSLVRFFGKRTATEVVASFGKADLVLGNNVLAHVPDINDFVGGLAVLLAEGGVLTMEFPHLVRLMDGNQFDTIYHEHFSYLSLLAVENVFSRHGLKVFDVEELPTHGGSLRVFACHEGSTRAQAPAVESLRGRERAFGLHSVETYAAFGARVSRTKNALLRFLIDAKAAGKKIVGYGAPGKGNTLLNYCGIRTDFLDFTVDRSPHKQGRFTPGTRIPILAPDRIREARPDYVLILPWNLREEVATQMAYIREWGGKFVVPIPSVEVF